VSCRLLSQGRDSPTANENAIEYAGSGAAAMYKPICRYWLDKHSFVIGTYVTYVSRVSPIA